MSKCKKVKNPCKICLGPVTQKTGLQCQGACECWIHYTCLNYTPGKIKDIKAGIIKVTCPCPDCNSTVPKEQLRDEPYSCTNIKCPANLPPRCDKAACPTNAEQSGRVNQTINAPPLGKCGTECKKHSTPNFHNSPGSPLMEPCAQPGPMLYPQRRSPTGSPFGTPKFPSGCSSSTDVPGDYRQSSMDGLPLNALEQMCTTVGQLTNQLNCLLNKMRQTVQERSPGGGGGGGCGGGNTRGCSRKGPKSMCPKPCYCPGNPGRRN